MSVFIIAEAGVNHNGDEAIALRLVEEAAMAGANAVKFQTFTADSLVVKGTQTAEYQEQQTGETDQHAMLKHLELSHDMHKSLLARCVGNSVEFMSTAFDMKSLDFLCELGIQRIKIPSGELTNTEFLSYSASKKLPIILSTGMATMLEVQDAVECIQKCNQNEIGNNSDNLTILHCTSNYPTALGDVNLLAMKTIGDNFGLPVGYSDHSTSIIVPAAAVALGAVVIEKHITLDTTMDGPDHASSLNPKQFTEMVAAVREVELCLGSAEKQPTDSELAVRDVVRRSVVVVNALQKGETIKETDISLQRPGTGIPPNELQLVVGKKTTSDLEVGRVLSWQDVQDA